MIFDEEAASDADDSAAITTADRPVREARVDPGHEPRAVRPPIAHPPAYRHVIAGWPLDRRERWGRRANELEDIGLSWRDAEAQAFVEVWNTAREGQAAVGLARADPDSERN